MVGTRIGNYQVEAKLGQGGMGVVYRALDLDLDRRVAIKLLHAEMASDARFTERFLAEAKAQAQLSHAHIASLYNLLNANGHIGIVMEYVEGETVEQMLRRRGGLPWQEAVALFQQALLGVGFAHRRGIVHRDLKPANLMVTPHGVVKVMDFGIAKVTGAQKLTRTGMSVGTVGYMSPEQVRNEGVDARTDIYALGITLYEMLTGSLPFEGTSEFQVLSDHVSKPAPGFQNRFPQIPASVEGAVLKALAKSPGERFQTAEEFGAALGVVSAGELRETVAERIKPTVVEGFQARAVAGGAAVAAAPGPVVAAAAKKPGNRKLMYGVGAAVVVLALTAGVFAMRPRQVAVAASAAGAEVGASVPLPRGVPESAGSSGASSNALPQATADGSSTGHDSLTQPSDSGSLGQSVADAVSGSGPDLRKTPGTSAAGKGSNAQVSLMARRQSVNSADAGQSGQPSTGSVKASNAPSKDAAASGAGAAAPPVTSSAAATPAAPAPAGPSDAELDSANEDLVKIRARMDAVHQSLATLKQEQASQGLGLRGDIVASESRLYSFYELADRALQQRNLTSAQRNMQQAQTELTKLEHFLGR